MTSGTLQPGQSVKFDEDNSGTVITEEDVKRSVKLFKEKFDETEQKHVLPPPTIIPGKVTRMVFGQDTIASLKEKQRQEKAAKKKLPKNFKPQDH